MADYFVDALGGQDFINVGQVNAAMGTFNPGDNIYFKRGDNYTDAALLPTVSGSAGLPITFGSWDFGPNPILGAAVADGILVINQSFLLFENFHISNATGNAVKFAGTCPDCGIRNIHADNTTATGFWIEACHRFQLLDCIKEQNTGNGYGLIIFGAGIDMVFDGVLLEGDPLGDPSGSSTAALYVRFAIRPRISNIDINAWRRVSLPTDLSVVYVNSSDGLVDSIFENINVNMCDGFCNFATTGIYDLTNFNSYFSKAQGIIFAAGSTVIMKNSEVMFAESVGAELLTSGSLTLLNCRINRNKSNGVQVTGTVTLRCENSETNYNGILNVINNIGANGIGWGDACQVELIKHESSGNTVDGFSSNGTLGSVADAWGCKAHSNGSPRITAGPGDGFTSHDTSVFNLYGCESSRNIKAGMAATQQSSGQIRNCTFVRNGSNADVIQRGGIVLYENTNFSLSNNICEDNFYEVFYTSTNAYVSDESIFWNTWKPVQAFYFQGANYDYAGFVVAAGEGAATINQDPMLADVGDLDFTPIIGSPAIGTGIKWWNPTDPRPVSASGEPYPDTKIDKGGIQSLLDPNHPENL